MKTRLALAISTALLCSTGASAALISNNIAAGTEGHFSVDVTSGGETRDVTVTAENFASGNLVTEEIVYDYFSYVDVGQGGFRLSGSTATEVSPGTVNSSGFFTGSLGNIINWNVDSVIADGDNYMYNIFTFTAEQGELGQLDFFQYLDEDVDGASNDVFFTRGSVATADLELFTVDNEQVFGISHGGALNDAQGLINASFAGFAACTFNNMRPQISSGTLNYSQNGEICSTLNGEAFTHPQVGAAYGPRDIVSSLVWSVNRTATSATIVTSLGGVTNLQAIDPVPDPIPEPPVWMVMLAGLGLLGFKKRRK